MVYRRPAKPTVSLSELTSSANDAARTARGLIMAMLGTAVTLAATVLASTDQAILRDSLQAPFGIGVSIRLSIAYALMPPVFLFLHVTVLLQLHVLAVRIHSFNTRLKNESEPSAARDAWRQQLSDFWYVQYYVDDEEQPPGMEPVLEYIRNGLLWVVIQVSIVWVPLIILIGAQISFLRYQSETISTIHQLMVLLDIAFIIWFNITQGNLLKAPKERIGSWLLITSLILLDTWLLGWPVSYAICFLSGMIGGWIAITAQRLHRTETILFLGPWVTWIRPMLLRFLVFLVFVGLLLWAVPDASVRGKLDWHLAAALGFLTSIFVDATQRGLNRAAPLVQRYQKRRGRAFRSVLCSAQQAICYVPKIEHVAAAIAFAIPILWLSLFQATIPDANAPTCQIRWNATTANDFVVNLRRDYGNYLRRQNSGQSQARPEAIMPALLDYIPQNISAPILDFATIYKLNAAEVAEAKGIALKRYQEYIELIALPVLGLGDSRCISSDPATRSDALVLRDGTDVNRANILDRWTCAQWQVGCRFLDVSSLSFGTAPGKSIGDVSTTDKAARYAGLIATGRSLRFLVAKDSSLIGADFRWSDLRGAEMSGGNFEAANFYQADLRNAALRGGDFNRAVLAKARISGANFGYASLRMATLDSAIAERTIFVATDLAQASLSHLLAPLAIFSGSSLDGANLEGAKLPLADLRGVSLDGTFLKSADLLLAKVDSLTSFRSAFVVGTSMQGVHFNRTDMTGAIFIANTDSEGKVTTKTPPNLSAASSSSMRCRDVLHFGDIISGQWQSRARESIVNGFIPYFEEGDISTETIKDIASAVNDQNSASTLLCSAVLVTKTDKPYRRLDFPGTMDRFIQTACKNPDTAIGIGRNIRNIVRQTSLDEVDRMARKFMVEVGRRFIDEARAPNACPALKSVSTPDIDNLEHDIYIYTQLSEDNDIANSGPRPTQPLSTPFSGAWPVP